LGDVLITTMHPAGLMILGTLDGEILGLLNNGAARWINHQFLKFLEDAKGAMSRDDYRIAWYGLNLIALTPSYAEARKIPTQKAVRVRGVVPGSPAEAAGFRRDDIVFKVNDKGLEQSGDAATQEFINRIQVKPGEAVKFRIWRENREMELTCVPLKPPVPKTASSDQLGLTVKEILPSEAFLNQYPTDQGVVVHQVDNGGPAMYARLSPANPQMGIPTMIITEMAGVPIKGLADFFTALAEVRRQSKPLLVKGYKGIEFFLTVIDPTIGAKRTGPGASSDEEEPPSEGEDE